MSELDELCKKLKASLTVDRIVNPVEENRDQPHKKPDFGATFESKEAKSLLESQMRQKTGVFNPFTQDIREEAEGDEDFEHASDGSLNRE